MSQQIVVVGAGQAGQSVIETLRGDGFDGKVTLIGEEAEAPYQRPPLSKDYLLGKTTLERLKFKPADYYGEHSIDTFFDDPATALDRAGKSVTLASGKVIAFDKLVLTTGATPRRLPDAIGGNLPNVFTMRSAADAQTIAPHISEGKRVLIVGGGYIGLEAAAVARQRGLEVHVVEAAPRLLARVASKDTSAFMAQLHESQGVTIKTDCGLDTLVSSDGNSITAQLSDGTALDVDFVILGIGVTPNEHLATNAGLTVENGIAVNEFCETMDASILSAGDCASFPYKGPDGTERRIRLESVHNAIAQAAAAAHTILGSREPYTPVPWFWSDQYDLKMQIVGLADGHDTVVKRDGKRDGTFSLWHFKQDILLSVDAFNDPRAYMMGKRLLEEGKSPTHDQVADPELNLLKA